MWDVSVCVGCLATDVRMYRMSASDLLQPYLVLVGVKNIYKHFNEMPEKLCWECAVLVNKFNMFRHKCERAHQLLRDIYTQHQEETSKAVQNIDRKNLGLESSLATSVTQNFNSENIETSKREGADSRVKSEFEVQFLIPHKTRTKLVSVNCNLSANGNFDINTEFIKVEPDFDDTARDDENYEDIESNETKMKTRKSSKEVDSLKTTKKKRKNALPHQDKYVKTLSIENVSKLQKTHRKRASTVKKVKHKSAGKVGRKSTIDYDITTVNLTQEQMMEVIRDRQNNDNYKISPYKCTLCYRGYREEKTYKNHMMLHDPMTGVMECDICKFRMKTRGRVHRHISNYHLRKYICNICSSVNYSQDGARIHYMYHTGVTYPCQVCGEKFRKISSRLNHMRVKHPSDHVCAVCSQSFVSPLGLARHTALAHSQLRSDAPDATRAPSTDDGRDDRASETHCVECDIRFVTPEARTRHLLISPRHERERDSILNGCRDCGRTFPVWPQLKAHRRAEHPGKPQPRAQGRPRAGWQDKPCVQCGEVMTSDRRYRGHFQVKHPGEPWPFKTLSHPFICELCGKGFNCNANLLAHRNLHTGTRAYKCDICTKSFYLPFNLKQHYVAHSDARPHACGVCGRGFKVKNGLERHMRSHTGEKPYKCTTCGKPFSSSTGRNAHMRAVHHTEPPLPAPFHTRRVTCDKPP